jgi:hypothetical protein
MPWASTGSPWPGTPVGGSHAVACAAVLAHRVLAVLSISAPAPFDAAGVLRHADTAVD